jgi:hypothetical protein
MTLTVLLKDLQSSILNASWTAMKRSDKSTSVAAKIPPLTGNFRAATLDCRACAAQCARDC